VEVKKKEKEKEKEKRKKKKLFVFSRFVFKDFNEFNHFTCTEQQILHGTS